MSVTIDQTTAKEEEFKIRPLRSNDIPELQAIDHKITQRARTWENVDIYLAGKPLLSFVAECEGQVIGFLLGDVKSYEFGIAQSAWIETIGIAPDFERRGVGTRLVQAFLDHCRRSGIRHVQTLIQQDDKDLQLFLNAVGFTRGSLVNYEKAL